MIVALERSGKSLVSLLAGFYWLNDRKTGKYLMTRPLVSHAENDFPT